MQILTLDNETFPLRQIPDELEEEVRFAVLDNSVILKILTFILCQ